jgi:SAM-dependent methyltransferase
MANEAMREYWGADAGERWVRDRERFDAVLKPFLEVLLDAAAVRAGESVLDVGCGAGTTTLALAERCGPTGRVTGAANTAPLAAELYRRAATAPTGRLAPITTVVADAQVDPLPGPFDLAVSRFGVMFFDDQAAAWRNIHAAMRPGGRLAFVCWQSADRNPWSRVPTEAALAVAPPPPDETVAASSAPGPYALADATQTERWLLSAGWREVSVRPIDTEVELGADLDGAVAHLRRQSGIVAAIERAGEVPVMDAVARALAPYAVAAGGPVRLDAAAWLVTASA